MYIYYIYVYIYNIYNIYIYITLPIMKSTKLSKNIMLLLPQSNSNMGMKYCGKNFVCC